MAGITALGGLALAVGILVDTDRQTLDAATLLTQAHNNLLRASVALVPAPGSGWE